MYWTLGFSTWISSVRDLALRCNLDINEEQSTELFKIECTKIVEKHYVSKWQTEIMDHEKYPILRTYVLYKTVYEMEPYLYMVKNPKYRITISKIRTSSHKLEIERGRYTRPITPIEKRICHLCKVVEDEFHFMLQCYIYTVERRLVQKNSSCGPIISRLTSSRQICISHDIKWCTNVNMGRQICPQFIWKARKLYATVRDDSFCVVSDIHCFTLSCPSWLCVPWRISAISRVPSGYIKLIMTIHDVSGYNWC